MKKITYMYYFSKWTVVWLLICVVGGTFTVEGLVRQEQRNHIKNAYDISNIRMGDCIEYDISYDMLLRAYHKGALSERYAPICTTDAVTMDNHYIAATGESKEAYICLVAPPKFQQELQQLIDGEAETYHVFGRIERLKFDLTHDDYVMEGLIYCTGIRDKTKLAQMVSDKYQLKIIDAEEQESMWYKGLIFFVMGILGVLGSVEKKPSIN